MTRATVYRHDIDFGERVHWTPPPDTAEFYVWSKLTVDNAAMRWRRLGGWNIANNAPVSLSDAPGGQGVSISNAEVALDWPDLLMMFDGFDNEIFQITTLNGEGRAVTRDVYSLPAPTSTNASTIAAQERRVLKDLLDMRLGLAGMHGGHVKVSTPDGTEVERMPIAVIDRRITEVRARIKWYELAAEGIAMPGVNLW